MVLRLAFRRRFSKKRKKLFNLNILNNSAEAFLNAVTKNFFPTTPEQSIEEWEVRNQNGQGHVLSRINDDVGAITF